MLFNSIEFLFFFLPVVLLVFLLLRHRGHMPAALSWLTLASLSFYAWWNPIYLALLLLSACVNYGLGLQLGKREQPHGGGWLTLGIFFNLGLLAYFKYANFFLNNISGWFASGGNFEHIVLPLAISFYTFQQITYLVDTRRGLTAAHGFRDYLLFVSFFPQLIAGPIVHHSEMLQQFRNAGQDRDTLRDLALGYSILVIGLFKKVVIADSFALYATPVFNMAEAGQAFTSLDAVAGILSYAFQLYFDFSGYSDMAIGLACMFGMRLPVNFFSPYRAQNISDFWRMWHATLSRFLRDYVYSPLGGFLCSPRRQRFNLFMTMFAGGVWHGAGWTFVLYGVCHGLYVVIHQLWRIRIAGPMGWVGKPGYKAAAQFLTFTIVVLTLGLFRAETVTGAGHLYLQLFNWDGGSLSTTYKASLNSAGLFKLEAILQSGAGPVALVFIPLLIALAICWLLPNTYQLFSAQEAAIAKPAAGRPSIIRFTWRAGPAWALFIALLALSAGLNLSEPSEFLYFQF